MQLQSAPVRQCLRYLLISAAALLGFALSAAATDWLYLSPGGGWLEQEHTVENYPYRLEIPGHAGRFWVSPESGDGDFTRERRSEIPVMEPGTEVEIATSVRLPGIGALVAGERLTVRQILGDRIVVSVDDKAVVLGPDSYSTLSFQVTPLGMDRVRLEADRPTPDTRRIAWHSDRLHGEVRYRLEMAQDEQAELHQYLQVRNEGELPLRADGLSWFRGDSDSAQPRMAVMAAESADSIVETAAGPVAALELEGTVRLPARSETWMPVSAQPVAVHHQYELSWDTRQGELRGRAADWILRVESEESLPRLSGRAEVNWFDQRLSSLDSRYQRLAEQETELALGRNDQVTLSVQTDTPEAATLRVHNQLDQPVEVSLRVSHQPNRQAPGHEERVVFTVAPGVSELSVRYTASDLTLTQP